MRQLTAEQRQRLAAAQAEIAEIMDPQKAAERKARRERDREMRKRVGKRSEGQRQPRVEEPAYLAWLRLQPCCVGPILRDACQGRTDPAHIRFSDYAAGRINPGKATKSDDKWCLPVCRKHHDAQHSHGNERRWWSAEVGADPTKLAIEHHERFSAETQRRKARA